MKHIYKKTENVFEGFTAISLKVFGSSVTFIVAVLIVIGYFVTTPFSKQSFHENIYNIILCFTFLGFFIIQKSFNKFNAALNLKVNELISAHEKASNRLVDIENRSEAELLELTKHYSEIAKESEQSGELHSPKSIEQKLNRQRDEGGGKQEE